MICEQRAPEAHDDWLDEIAVLHEGPEAPEGKCDLEGRVAKFGEAIVRFARKIPRGPGNDRIIGQLVGAGTSVGANYAEATECLTRKDFISTITRVVKEAKEAKFFLRMSAAAEPSLAPDARVLYREGHELHMIFASMRRNKREGNP